MKSLIQQTKEVSKFEVDLTQTVTIDDCKAALLNGGFNEFVETHPDVIRALEVLDRTTTTTATESSVTLAANELLDLKERWEDMNDSKRGLRQKLFRPPLRLKEAVNAVFSSIVQRVGDRVDALTYSIKEVLAKRYLDHLNGIENGDEHPPSAIRSVGDFSVEYGVSVDTARSNVAEMMKHFPTDCFALDGKTATEYLSSREHPVPGNPTVNGVATKLKVTLKRKAEKKKEIIK